MSTGTSTNPPNLAQENCQALLSLGAQEVFEMMAATQLTTCEQSNSGFTEMTGVIGLAGPICGVMSVCCSQKAALIVASRMLGTTIEEAQKDMLDAIGEICNMVAGNFKAKLGEMGEKTLLSVPAVIKGTQYRVCSAVKGEIVESFQQFEGEIVMFRLEYKAAASSLG